MLLRAEAGGYAADHPELLRARKKILEMGGVTEVNTFTKIYLCFFGQYDYDAVPAIPPEIVLFPKWFWFNIYEISSWSRTILVPLSICYAKKPFKKIPDELGVEELFVGGRDKSRMHLRWDKKLFSWRNFFLSLDRMTHWFERVHIRPLRSLALKVAEGWMLKRFEMSDGLGAIFPSMMNSIIALRCLGYSVDDPQVIRAMDEFEKLGIEENDTFRMQPCKSPVWDTAYALFTLGESGVPASDSRMVKCADWILQKQVRMAGDWKVKNKAGQPGGWYFEFNNEFYPDVDDTAMVCLGLTHVEHPTGVTSASRCNAPLIGYSPCSAATAAGPRSIKTMIAWCSSTYLSRTTMPCWTRRPWTSRAASWKCWRPTATTKTIPR